MNPTPDVRWVRAVLGDLVSGLRWGELWMEEPQQEPSPDTLPVLSPPLSRTIMQDRKEREVE